MAEKLIKLIEMVCTGNQGRSPVAELIARNYLQQIGADGYRAISSGTSVAAIKEHRVDVPFMIKVIGIGKERGLYNPSQVQAYDDAVRTGDATTLQTLYDIAQTAFGEEERRYRREVLPGLGIEGLVKEETEQTIQRDDTVGVFSMAQNNNAEVGKIYLDPPHQPVIAVLGAYAYNDPSAQIPNAFGQSKEVYVATVKAIQDAVPKAIDRLLTT